MFGTLPITNITPAAHVYKLFGDASNCLFTKSARRNKLSLSLDSRHMIAAEVASNKTMEFDARYMPIVSRA